jgi:hypothetical protein
MFPSLLPDAPARFLRDKNSFTVPSDLARHYHRSRITQRIQPSLLRTLPTLLFPTAASTELHSYVGMARSEQPNSLRSFSCFTLLPSQGITPTQSTPYHQVRTSVQSPQVSLRPEFRTSAEQNRSHQLPSKRQSSRHSSPWAATLQTPPQGCLVMLVKRRFARQNSVRYRCS